MKLLLVYCHPVEGSFNAAIRDAAMGALRRAGHEVDLLDLYAEGFEASLSAAERRAYHDVPANVDPIAGHVRRLRAAEGLVLVFPTWWYGMPALLKGWFDRIWVPGVAFGFDARGEITTNELAHIRALAVITTAGAPWWLTNLYLSHPLKKTIMRGLRRLMARRCRTLWLQHYSMDSSTADTRARFLAQVERRLAAL